MNWKVGDLGILVCDESTICVSQEEQTFGAAWMM